MTRMVTPIDLAMAGLKTWQLQMNAAAVIGMRMAGMAGAWAMPPSEMTRMVTEKQSAFAEAGRKMTVALMRGAAPLAVYEAGLAPVTRTAKANGKRLSRHISKR